MLRRAKNIYTKYQLSRSGSYRDVSVSGISGILIYVETKNDVYRLGDNT